MPVPASFQDVDLVRKVAQGDRTAFGHLFDRYSQLALNLASRVLNERQEAEDVVQEVFLQLWREAASYRQERGNVSSWIVAIARSRAIDKLRSRKARRLFDPAGESEEMQDLAEQLPDPTFRQEDLDNQLLVRKAFGSLAVDQRVAIEMAYYEGMSQSEIAEALREPLGTIKTRIRSGLLKLKQALSSGAGN
ncbi:MAG: sigma-70 family RNA polymerase sigma factor [Acidobacteria bacterium]|nr:sigma-70 family RNA polymerase sigma factor [Acidobacteriota bacterium]MCI0720635.1 sigma-70 family RNA polymerase sigma factor [Acidobacteriota bacterium]